jgi:hypothetical protein
MSARFLASYRPDPNDAVGVLAFVLCPASALAPGADAEELAAVAELIGPAKAEAVRRWSEVTRAGQRN